MSENNGGAINPTTGTSVYPQAAQDFLVSPPPSSLLPPQLMLVDASQVSLTALGNPQTGERFEVGKPDAHQRLDSKDERTLANNLADAERVEAIEKKAEEEAEDARRHPTELAKSHGNEPSRGAKIDEQIAAEEEEELKRKGKA